MNAVHVSLLVTSMLVTAGCVDTLAESTTDQAVESANRIAVNRIAVNRIAVNRIAVNRIAVNRIAVNRIAVNSIATGDMLETEGGREVFEYLVSCALPDGMILEAEVGDATYEFAGALGLTPKWIDRGLTKKERGWLSACMIARVNDAGHELLISLRGPHRALDVTGDEEAEYTIEEGAFFGDIFTAPDEPLVMMSCRGRGQIAGATSEDLERRGCARENPDAPGQSECWDAETESGIEFIGDCPVTCEKRHGANANAGYWERCHDDTSTTGKRGWAGTERYDQVITVFLR